MASSSTAELDYRPSYVTALLVSLAALVLYLVTLSPSTAMWDTSEYIAAAYTLGIPHPPGNPLFVILGRVFAILPIASNVAVRINILAALCSAVAAGMWFLVTERVLVSWFPARWQRRLGGALAALIGGTAFTVWNQSVVNEKVYTVSLVGIAIIAWLIVRWSDDPDGRKADRLLVLIAYLCGLGYANHMAGMLPAPAVALAVLVIRPRTIVRWRLLLACVGALVLGLTPFATQPIRAAYFPPINEGEPTACRTKLEASCTFSKGTYDAFMYNFNRGQYGKPDLSDRQAPFTSQIGMWWLYFKWQWLRDAHDTHPFPQALLAATFLVLGLVGGWVHWQRDRRSFWFFGAFMFTVTLLLIYYLNFKLGASQDPDLPVPHEVRDRDYFYLWSFSAWGVWAALGLLYVWQSIASVLEEFLLPQRTRRTRRTASAMGKAYHESAASSSTSSAVKTTPATRSLVYSSPVLLLALVPLFGNWSSASRHKDRATSDFAADLLNSVEPYGVLITAGDNDTFPLWYAQEVRGIRKDVVVAVTSLLNTDWYLRGIIRRPIYTYDAANGPKIYANRQWTKPTSPPLKLTLAEADAIPDYMQLQGPMLFTAPGIRATIDPRKLEYGILQRSDIAVLRMIADSWPNRPIYFSRTSGNYAASLGLGGDVLTQGLASKLIVPPAGTSRDTVYVQGDGWFDVRRTRALWDSVYTAPTSIIARGDWIDRPSVGIPYTYIAAGAELSDVLRARGDDSSANRVAAKIRRIADATRLTSLLGMNAPAAAAGASPPIGDSARGLSLGTQKMAEPVGPVKGKAKQ